MKALSSPGGLSILALLMAALAHPAADDLRRGDRGRFAVAFVAVLFVLALAAAGWQRRMAAFVLAAGVGLAMAGLGYDAIRGHAGRVVLRPGDASRTFDEEGAAGEPLGLRPLDFELKLQSAGPDAATLLLSGAPDAPPSLRVTPREAVAVGRLRLGWLRHDVQPRLLVGITRGGRRTDVEVASDQPGRADGLELTLVRYFPDFALDATNQPYSKSSEPHNPGALLHASQGGRAWNIFVLRALPDVHKVPDLDASFSLRDVAVDESLRLGVYKERAASLVAAGVLLAALGLALNLRA